MQEQELMELASRKAEQMTAHTDDVAAIATNLELEHKDLSIVAAKSDKPQEAEVANEQDQAELTSISTIGQNQEVLAENEVAKKHKIDALQQAKARMTDALDGKKQQSTEVKPTEVPQPQ